MTKQEITDLVLTTIQDYLNLDKPVFISDNLQALGADSLDIIQIVVDLENDTGVEISNSASENIKTPRELIDHIYAAQSRS